MIRPGTRLSRGVSHACASHLVCVCGSTRCSAGAARFASVRDCVCALRLGTLRQIAVSVSGVSVRGAVARTRSSRV